METLRALRRLIGGALCAAAICGVPAAQARMAVDLELALAVDVSGSIDDVEAQLQREGYIAAFRHPDVIRAIKNGMLGRIAVRYYEWAGYGHQRVIVDWFVISDQKSAYEFAELLTQNWPQTGPRTAIGDAITYAVPTFAANDFEGTRRVVDISGDGPNNWGEDVAAARDKAVAAGLTINGLPIVNDRPSRFGGPPMADLDGYYRDCVIGGPGAFLVVARSYKDFATAVRRKLILEISSRAPEPGDTAAGSLIFAAEKARMPCDIGAYRWRRLQDRDY